MPSVVSHPDRSELPVLCWLSVNVRSTGTLNRGGYTGSWRVKVALSEFIIIRFCMMSTFINHVTAIQYPVSPIRPSIIWDIPWTSKSYKTLNHLCIGIQFTHLAQQFTASSFLNLESLVSTEKHQPLKSTDIKIRLWTVEILQNMKTIVAVALFALTLTILVATSEAQKDNHWPYRGCRCQCCGDRGGHCHCDNPLSGVSCKKDGHYICYPWSSKEQCYKVLTRQPKNCQGLMG